MQNKYTKNQCPSPELGCTSQVLPQKGRPGNSAETQLPDLLGDKAHGDRASTVCKLFPRVIALGLSPGGHRYPRADVKPWAMSCHSHQVGGWDVTLVFLLLLPGCCPQARPPPDFPRAEGNVQGRPR